MPEMSKTVPKLDLIIIYPNNRKIGFGDLANDVAAITPPMQSALLYSYIQAEGFNVQLLDAESRNLSPDEVAMEIVEKSPKLVCISTDSLNSGDITKISGAIAVSKAIKINTPSIQIAIEGIVPTVYPERILKESLANYVLRGEVYAGLVALLKTITTEKHNFQLVPGLCYFENQHIVISDVPNKIQEVCELKIPWDVIPPSLYRAHHWHCFENLKIRAPYATIFTSLGCPYNCSYCIVNALNNKPCFRPRSIDAVMMDLDLLHNHYGVRNIRILDNVFTFKSDYVNELCDRIIFNKLHLNMWAYARIETIRDPQLLRKMKVAGVNWLAYGIESADESIRGGVAKSTGNKNIEQVLEWTSSAGIHIVGNFMFGLPHDNMESMNRTFEMAKRYCFEWANFYCTMAYPGSRLHEDKKEQDGVLPEEWSGYSQYASDSKPLPTNTLSSREVLRFRDEAFVQYYNYAPYRKKLMNQFGEEALRFIDKILKIKIVRTQTASEETR